MWAGAAASDGTRKVHGLVVFDAVMLGGRPLTRLTFRERRARLESVVVETPRLKLAPGTELDKEAPFIAAAKIELFNSLSAEARANEKEAKAISRTCGIVFKA